MHISSIDPGIDAGFFPKIHALVSLKYLVLVRVIHAFSRFSLIKNRFFELKNRFFKKFTLSEKLRKSARFARAFRYNALKKRSRARFDPYASKRERFAIKIDLEDIVGARKRAISVDFFPFLESFLSLLKMGSTSKKRRKEKSKNSRRYKYRRAFKKKEHVLLRTPREHAKSHAERGR